ncbi:MAG: hypothetical protein NTZ98_21050 [Acidobacteria bacterium]|nr:hypothetical protein [Acidobacteriota bacterium]
MIEDDMRLENETEFRAALNRVKTRLAASHNAETIRAARAQTTLAEVEAALQRLAEGTYGVCRGCFLIIPTGELLRCPQTQWCAECRSRRMAAQRAGGAP